MVIAPSGEPPARAPARRARHACRVRSPTSIRSASTAMRAASHPLLFKARVTPRSARPAVGGGRRQRGGRAASPPCRAPHRLAAARARPETCQQVSVELDAACTCLLAIDPLRRPGEGRSGSRTRRAIRSSPPPQPSPSLGEGESTMTSVIAIDQGTTGTKAHRLRDDGTFETIARLRASPDLSAAGLGRARSRRTGAPCRKRARCRPATPPPSASPTRARPSSPGTPTPSDPIHNAIVWQDARTADVDRAAEGRRRGGADAQARRPAARSLFLRRQAALAARQRAGSSSAAPSADACASAPATPFSSTA